MYKLLLSVFFVLLFSGCGVQTSSSSNTAQSYEDNSSVDSDWYGDGYIIDPNPIGDGSSDDNTSDGGDNNTSDNNTSDDDIYDGVLSQEDSYFDISNAEYDQFACKYGDINDGYTDQIITDDSIDDRSTINLEYGVSINSLYPISYAGGNEVSLFYYSLKPNLKGIMVNIYHDSLYRLSIDKAWADNDQKKVYIMTPANSDGYPSCYRYDLSTIDDNTYQRTKVYREK